MTVAIVQAQSVANGAGFANPVGAGNTVFFLPVGYEFGASAITTSNPLLGGAAVSGSLLIASAQNLWDASTGDVAYAACWMLPNVTGGVTSTSLTITSGNILDMFILEVSGLGVSPSLDQESVGAAFNSSTLIAGPTGPTAASQELVIAEGVLINEQLQIVGSPWTSLVDNSHFGQLSYQVSGGVGSTYQWSTNGAAANAWAALCVTIKSSEVVISSAPLPELDTVPQLNSRIDGQPQLSGKTDSQGSVVNRLDAGWSET